MLKNLELSKKLILGLGIMVAISAAMMIIAIVSLHDIGGLVNRLYQSPFTVSTRVLCCRKKYKIWDGKYVAWCCMRTLLILIPY